MIPEAARGRNHEFHPNWGVTVKPDEPIEIFSFMEAADERKRQGGAPVEIRGVLKRARK